VEVCHTLRGVDMDIRRTPHAGHPADQRPHR
jgi:hypothetical protein